MRPYTQQVFLALICWCLWQRSFSERREYLGRLDACRCVPLDHPCTEEVVAISFLTTYRHPVKVCVQGTRLCCQESQETSSPTASTMKPNEDLYYLLVKLPLVGHQSNYHNNLPDIISGTVNPRDIEGGLLHERDEDVTTTESTRRSSTPGEASIKDWNDMGTRWPEDDEPFTKVMHDRTLKSEVNQTEVHMFTIAAEFDADSGGDASVHNSSTSEIVNAPSPSPSHCFTVTCHGNSTASSILSTEKAETAMIASVDLREDKISTQTGYRSSTEEKTTEHHTTQEQTTASSRKQNLMKTTTPWSIVRLHNPLLLPKKTTTTMNMNIAHRFYPFPSPGPIPITTPRLRTTTPATTTTTTIRSFFAWLFG